MEEEETQQNDQLTFKSIVRGIMSYLGQYNDPVRGYTSEMTKLEEERKWEDRGVARVSLRDQAGALILRWVDLVKLMHQQQAKRRLDGASLQLTPTHRTRHSGIAAMLYIHY